ncbi:Exostosin-like protein [Corchorus olitorius]|uniref:Exostosin-like protein n=1 Tax=Corchorus olitorius TaxID=93759 RepID=A0A1R3GX56_9ROSI|nr:Exostosin-like protein [Corchorus olitorius]
MGKPSSFSYPISELRFSTASRKLFFLPLSLAISTFFVIFLYIYCTNSSTVTSPPLESNHYQQSQPLSSLLKQLIPSSLGNAAEELFYSSRYDPQRKQWPTGSLFGLYGNYVNNTEVYRDKDLFLEDYKEMNRSLKIYIYPHSRDDPFANVLLAVDYDPKGNYASELYFKKVLWKSHFITKDPNEADLFFMPFSMVEMRLDPRIGPEGTQDFIKGYILDISHKYPYWNRTKGADHFYVACHPIEQHAMDKIFEAKFNVIQVVCSSSYFVAGYIPHKDASIPQIWPRVPTDPPNLASSKRKQLAFFAGTVNSYVRVALLQAWGNDTDILAHFRPVRTSDADHLLGSKFCLNVKGFEVNSARLADAIHYGCVPVILANHYDLPFADILNWESFSVVVHYMDIPVLKNILQRISLEEYSMLQSNTLKVRRHFQWNDPPVDYDAFYMTIDRNNTKNLTFQAIDLLLTESFKFQIFPFQPDHEEMIPFSIDNTAEDLYFDLPRTSSYAKQNQWSIGDLFGLFSGETMNNTEIYHDPDMFLQDYKLMNDSFKIFVYPHKADDPFANVLLPVDFDPQGHYASELYFKKSLFKSHFITKDPNEADLFYMPFSIVEMRHDPRIGPEGIQDFIRDYIFNISHTYPYWNRTGGADHFYVACHSISRIAMDKVAEAKQNSIQVVCSSTYFAASYFPHKDVAMPQIWPKEKDPKKLTSSKRKQLAFFAGQVNSPVRAALLKYLRNDTDIYVHFGRFEKDDGEQQLHSKFCLHVKGFEVNTARITDALHYGCVPVILANHYDLPFADIINWRSFSVVVHYLDIPVLKKILQGISFEEYSWLQSNALKVRKHFKWNVPPVDYDAFYMAMYQLWLRRSSIRVRLSSSKELI